jgi:hypothetical protein
MKKIYTTLVAIFAITQFSYGQWAGSSGDIYYNTGNVGIGTLPDTKLQILEPSDSKPAGSVAYAKSILKLSRAGTPNYSYNESAEFRIGHGGPTYWGSKLDLYINGSNNQNNIPDQQVMTWLYNGNVGIGTTSPTTALQIGDLTGAEKQLSIPGTYNFEQVRLGQLGNGNAALEFVNHTGVATSYGVKLLVDVDHGAPGLQFQYATASTNYSSLSYSTGLYMNLSGNVGIGTTDPQGYKLAVNGSAIAESVTVKLHESWPDYVFKPAYTLPSLNEIKTYIDQNHHLPDMPSEAEVAKDGLNLGEINKLLTKKVEELTLYLIDQSKQISELKQQVEAINKTLNKN